MMSGACTPWAWLSVTRSFEGRCPVRAHPGSGCCEGPWSQNSRTEGQSRRLFAKGPCLVSPAPHLYAPGHPVTSSFLPLSCCSLMFQLWSSLPPHLLLTLTFSLAFQAAASAPSCLMPPIPVTLRASPMPLVVSLSPSLVAQRGDRNGKIPALLIQAPIQKCSSPVHIPHPFPTEPWLSLPGRELPGRCRVYF